MKPATKANSKKENLKEKDLLNLLIKIHTMEASKMDCIMDTGSSSGVMGINTKVNMWRVKEMAMG